jgi:transmembrane sensor
MSAPNPPNDNSNDVTVGSPPIDWHILDRYLIGECTEAERATVEAWRQASAQNRELIEAIDSSRSSSAARQASIPIDALWQRVRERTVDSTTATPHANRTVALHPASDQSGAERWSWIARIAAVLLVISGLGVGAHYFVKHRTRPAATVRAEQEFRTANAQIAKIELIDGTRVVLGPGSLMTTRTGFGAKTREIDLEGAAYFTVQHDTERPFIVHTNDAATLDIGTKFSIESYPEMKRSEIVVAEGSVDVRAESTSSRDSILLMRGEGVSVSRNSAPRIMKGIDLDLALDWVRGEQHFSNVPFGEIVPEIERSYGIEVELASPELAKRRLTVAFVDQTTPELIRTLGILLDATIEMRGTHVVFRASKDKRQAQVQ